MTIHERAMELFRDQAFTISKRAEKVSITCTNPDDAEDIFYWLASINGQYGKVEDWLDEIESFSVRRERVTIEMLPYLKAAFNAGCSRDLT